MYTSIHRVKKIVTSKSTNKDDAGKVNYRTVTIKATDSDDKNYELTLFVTEDVKLLESFED
jgi:hypothetical protein